MAIDFNVEDGTIVADATSYLETADLDQLALNEGIDISALTTDDMKMQYLNRYTPILDAMKTWPGEIVSATQNLAWPRKGGYDINGNAIDDASIPKEIKRALLLLIKNDLAGVDITPVQETSGEIQSESSAVSGAVSESKSYFQGTARSVVNIPEMDLCLKKICGAPNSYNLSLGRS